MTDHAHGHDRAQSCGAGAMFAQSRPSYTDVFALRITIVSAIYNIGRDGDQAQHWYVDTSVLEYMIPCLHQFREYESLPMPIYVQCPNRNASSSLVAVGRGTVELRLSDEYGGTHLTLGEVLHVPAPGRNVLTLGRVEAMGCLTVVTDGVLRASKSNVLLFTTNMRMGTIYALRSGLV